MVNEIIARAEGADGKDHVPVSRGHNGHLSVRHILVQHIQRGNGCAGKGQCVFGDDMVNEMIAKAKEADGSVLPLRLGRSSALLTPCLNAPQQPCHIPAQVPHGLEALLVLFHQLRGGTKDHIPVGMRSLSWKPWGMLPTSAHDGNGKRRCEHEGYLFSTSREAVVPARRAVTTTAAGLSGRMRQRARSGRDVFINSGCHFQDHGEGKKFQTFHSYVLISCTFTFLITLAGTPPTTVMGGTSCFLRCPCWRLVCRGNCLLPTKRHYERDQRYHVCTGGHLDPRYASHSAAPLGICCGQFFSQARQWIQSEAFPFDCAMEAYPAG